MFKVLYTNNKTTLNDFLTGIQHTTKVQTNSWILWYIPRFLELTVDFLFVAVSELDKASAYFFTAFSTLVALDSGC